MQVMAQRTKKILIVDDDAACREAIRLALIEQDFIDIEFSESASVACAIQQMTAIHPDIVILDLHMPGQNGFDFMDIVHKNKRFADTEVIMLTADGSIENCFKAEIKGIKAFHFIAKPFNISDLQALVFSVGMPDKV